MNGRCEIACGSTFNREELVAMQQWDGMLMRKVVSQQESKPSKAREEGSMDDGDSGRKMGAAQPGSPGKPPCSTLGSSSGDAKALARAANAVLEPPGLHPVCCGAASPR